MCGIAGFQLRDRTDDMVELHAERLRHRGPDARGCFRDGQVQLLHHRLSIVDPSPSGNQPIANEDETLWLVFNGEIYNAPLLRPSLEAAGHVFRGKSDGEVLLHLYEEDGPSMLGRLRGMFAFAIYDARRKELFLARDPFGIKPLFYTEPDSGFGFASELRALVGTKGFSRRMDWEAFLLYTRLNFIPAPWTIWQDARRLEPGTWLRVREGRIVEKRRYYELRSRPWEGDYTEALRSLESTLLESAHQHLLSDVPLGAFLSGGLDSSIVATFAQRFLDEPLRTFTVTFPDEAVFDESVYAREVATHIGANHEEIPVSSGEASEAVLEILDHLDEPFGDSSLVAAAIVSKVTRRHVKAALAGDGGDELFAGYSKYQGLRLAGRLYPLSPLLRAAARLPIPEHQANRMGKRWRQFRRLAHISEPEAYERYRRSTELVGDRSESMLNGHRRGLPSPGSVGRDLANGLLADLWETGQKAGFANGDLWLYTDTRFGLSFDMLHKVDVASMRYSLEVRVPFLDPEVVQLAFRLPFDWKLSGHERKRILGDMAKRHLPAHLIDRPKQGFGFPVGEWMRKDLRGLFDRTCARDVLEETGVWDSTRIERMVSDHMGRRRDCYRELWNLLVFEHWRAKWNPELQGSPTYLELDR